VTHCWRGLRGCRRTASSTAFANGRLRSAITKPFGFYMTRVFVGAVTSGLNTMLPYDAPYGVPVGLARSPDAAALGLFAPEGDAFSDLVGRAEHRAVASGWSGCRVGLAPTGKRRLVTAHTQSGYSRGVETVLSRSVR
jgi:hypothetical protein